MNNSCEKEKLELLATRQENLYNLNHFDTTASAASILNQFATFTREELEQQKFVVRVAGRIMRLRKFGSLSFAVLRCFDGDLQLVIITDKSFNIFDLGDVIGVEGHVYRTNRGELSLKVLSHCLLSKCLRPLPDLHYGFTDVEERFRNRHLDFIINKASRQRLITRARLNGLVRKFLDQKGFIEVETPILVAEASGAQARPFTTHHHTLNRHFQLRIATEIPLKTLIIGGFEKIYELGKVFRNEGIDARHNPEFTTVEVYEAYRNATHMMDLAEELVKFTSTALNGDKKLYFRGQLIDLTKPFQRRTMLTLIQDYTGVDFSQVSAFTTAAQLAAQHAVQLEKHQSSTGQVILAFFEKFVEPQLLQPTFVCDYPLEVSPLAKRLTGKDNLADRFELFISGIEFANGYSELNNPFEQRERFEQQRREKTLGNTEIAALDNEFIEALHYGMPPTGGLGLGIDRLVMLLTEQVSIREVVAFPQMKKR